jgi:Family of unknown function (DUF5681)
MNEIVRRGRPWQPGQSGNPAGRPIGSRQKIAEAIIRDISVAWQTHGVDVLNKIAISDPAKFAQLAAGLIPREFQLSVEARLPGGLQPDDWQIAMQVFEAVKTALPDASNRQPGEVLNFVLDAVRAHDAKLIESGEPCEDVANTLPNVGSGG